MDTRYAKSFLAGWATIDVNGHMANTAYLDLAAGLDLRARKLVAPPPELLGAFAQVPRSPDFVELPKPSR